MKKRLLIVLPILAALAVAVFFTVLQPTSKEQPKVQQAAEVDHDQSERPALPTMLEVGSEGCIPCEKMKPVMAQLIEEYGDIIHIEFHDIQKNHAIATKYSVRLIPTQIFLKADGTEFFRHEGFFPKEDIEKVFRDMGVPL